jgi:NAD(P)-dependent dehydrogenase (short-subunit alcohol dehydrogenase family)
MDLELAGRVVFVSGSHRGTGEGIARVLAREGAHVLVHGFHADEPERVVAQIRADGGRADGVHGDITNDDGAAQAVRAAQSFAAQVDVLVNNYGVAEGGSWLGSSTRDWIAIYEKNVLSAVRLTQAFVPGMKARGFGRVIFVGTIGSSRPAARMPHYYASKAALPNMTVSLAKELASSGVTANLVSPGLIATREVRERFSEERLRDNPAGVICTPEDVGHLVAFLASPRSACVNGANLRIDGGAADCVN